MISDTKCVLMKFIVLSRGRRVLVIKKLFWDSLTGMFIYGNFLYFIPHVVSDTVIHQ